MNCPQGHTLNGKMCTIAPTLSCPMGYTLVNGMCQEDTGIQGFGDSMNIPPTDSLNLQPSDTMTPPPPSASPVVPVNVPIPGSNLLTDVVNRVVSELPLPQQMPRISPIPVMRPTSPTRINAAAPAMRPTSPTRVAAAAPAMMPTSPTVMGMRPASPGGNCPMGYTLNRMDNLCYPL